MSNYVHPVYSHGGTTDPNFPTVAGTSDSSAGNPISIIGATHRETARPVMVIQAPGSGTSVTVKIQSNGLEPTGTPAVPPTAGWMDEGTYTISAGEAKQIKLPLAIPYFRTYRVSNVGYTGGVVSYVPCIHVETPRGLQWGSASHPKTTDVGTAGQ